MIFYELLQDFYSQSGFELAMRMTAKPELDDLLYEREGNIATITLNRPDKMNALSFDMSRSLDRAIRAAEDDDDVKVVIIKGAGGNFSAGYDLTKVYHVYEQRDKEPGKRRPSQRARLYVDKRYLLDPLQQIFNCTKPTIAQVEGWCIGGGMYITLCTDITIAASDAKMSHREQRLAFAGSMFVLPLEIFLIGQKKTRELLLTGQTLSGDEAEKIGLINKSVPKETLDEEVKRYANAICLNSRDAIGIAKAFTQLCYESLGMSTGFTYGYISHSFSTNLRFEPDEYSFIAEREKTGAKKAFHILHDRFRKYGFE